MTAQGSGTVVISGASGFIGSALTDLLTRRGRRVVRLVRRAALAPHERMWDPDARWVSSDVLEGADAVVNLSGASIAKLPWTFEYKKTILRSRVQATATLAAAIASAQNPPRVFVSASASGFYGDRPGELLDEDKPVGEGFLAKVVQSWEAAASPAARVTRVVHPRTGLVLGHGGVLHTLRRLAKAGLAGPVGSGEQHWPWITLHDEVAAIAHLIDSDLSGPVNLSAPATATADQLLREIAQQVHRPYWLPAPSLAIRLVLADAGRDLLLADQRLSSSKLTDSGFRFRDVTLSAAVTEALADDHR